MKLTLVQALATVLNIQEEQSAIVGGSNSYVIRGARHDGTDWVLGSKDTYTLEQAVREACEGLHVDDMKKECNFAIFPMDSDRGMLYMQMERKLLIEEAQIKAPHEGMKMWQLFPPNDPRGFLEAFMTQLGAAAKFITAPQKLRETVLSLGCLVVASLQWLDDWMLRLAVRRVIPQTGHTLPPAGMKMHVEKFDDDLRTGQHNQE